FLGNMGGNPAGFFFPLFLQNAHGYTPADVTKLFFIGGAVGIMGNIIVGRLSDRFGRRHMGSLCYLLAPLMTIWIYNTSGRSVIPAWELMLFFDTAGSTIFSAYAAGLFPPSPRSTGGSARSVAGASGRGIGFLPEGLLYR